MEDSNKPNFNKLETHKPLGMSSFGVQEREQFGRDVRLAMGCIEGNPELVKGNAIPSDESSIRKRLKALAQEITSQHADLLELLVRFDDLQSWKSSGAQHCAAWMNVEIGIGIQLSWEYLRVGRKLLMLPTVRALFRAGKLSWSKVREITRVADENNEKLLCHAALDASVSDVKRLCDGFRWVDDENGAAENDRALKQWESHALTWSEASNRCTRIQLILPPEIAQAFLNSVEHSLNQVEASDNTMSQRRADAAVLMAETSLQNAGRDIATADRYQVIVSVDAGELSETDLKNTPERSSETPTKCATVRGAGAIARETAKRLSCDCSITTIKTAMGEPIDIGRKSRIWPNAMVRAIKERDQHCVWPGCTQSRHLHIHHIEHWADGGTTSVQNGACLCSHHHTLVHEGGYRIQHVENNDQRMNEQFVQQLNTEDRSQFDFELALRNDRESFNEVRRLSAPNYRFRVVDAAGQVFTGKSDEVNYACAYSEDDVSLTAFRKDHEYIRIHCGEPIPGSDHKDYVNSLEPHAQAVTYAAREYAMHRATKTQHS